jgi:carboxypeptidase T
LYAGEAARAPYKLSLGPTTLSAKAKHKASGDVRVKINASDDAYGTFGVDRPAVQDVVAARIYVGKPEWAGGNAIPMTIKGSGSDVTATVTITPGARKKLAWTQAKDADGNWGPVRAVWIPKA